jgi:hypothetical protein
MTAVRFPIRIERRFALPLRVFGVDRANAYVEISEDQIVARFGWSSATTPLTNVRGWRIEGPWPAITAIGIRRSLRHGDVTYGGSPRGGVRLDFVDQVTLKPFSIPALYVTVEDLEGFAAALAERGILGVDARTRIAD